MQYSGEKALGTFYFVILLQIVINPLQINTNLAFTRHLWLIQRQQCLLRPSSLYMWESENKSLCWSGNYSVFRTCSVSGYRSVDPHFQDPLKSLYVGNHWAVAQCDTSLTGSGQQIASVAVIRLLRVDFTQQIQCCLSRQRCHSFLFSLYGKVQQINLYLIQSLNLLVPNTRRAWVLKMHGISLFSWMTDKA